MWVSTNKVEMLLMLLLVQTLVFSYSKASINFSCIKSERDILLKLKRGISSQSNQLSSWDGEDCCAWKGVGCSQKSGHVIILDLLNQPVSFATQSNLRGEVADSLFSLTHLQYLDLSFSNFSGTQIPILLGSLRELKYLNLSSAQFQGKVPLHIKNLSNLKYLDLSWNDGLIVDDLQWVSTLSSLKVLDLSGVNLSKADNWLHSISMLPSSLVELHLSSSNLPRISLSSPTNLTSLAFLDLSSNHFNSSIPPWLFNNSKLQYLNLSENSLRGSIPDEVGKLSRLSFLDLSYNELEGDIPETLGNLCNLHQLSLAHNRLSGHITAAFGSPSSCIKSSLKSLVLEINYFSGMIPSNLGNFEDLEYLNLYSNAFHGPIPASLGRLANLRVLELSHNYLNGSVPESLGQLSQLEILDIHNNSLNGNVSEVHFSRLSRLTTLFLYENSVLVLDVAPTWTPTFQIQRIALYGCKVGPQFPPWLRTQTNISILEMSNTSISDSIPDWFEDITSSIVLLDLSRNKIGKGLPKLRQSSGIPYRFIYLYSNRFEGPVTHFPGDVSELDLSNNLLWGHIPPTIGDMMPRLTLLHLFNNSLNGNIPASLCKMEQLQYLDLSKNQLSGRVPQCWRNLQSLRVMDLSDNALAGRIPTSLGSLRQLRSLHLERNKLEGNILDSLKELKSLHILDLSENSFMGIIPTWIGESLSSLRVLNLDSNRLGGQVPTQLCYITSLRILNLANNEMNGPIPSCFSNFSAMAAKNQSSKAEESWLYNPTTFGNIYGYQTVVYDENVLVYMKGLERQYTKTLPFLFSIDISRNNFAGQIPEELTSLAGLQNLNLSRNNLTGHIPRTIGNLKALESLDLSRNELSGSIPQSIVELNFLSHLSLAFNKLKGPIPSGNQLQTLQEEFMYEGNNGLCGAPLKKSCLEAEGGGDHIEQRKDEEDDDWFEMAWFQIGMATGFVVGFVGVCSTLYVKKSWTYQ
ncbi:hypothetical protein Tsubulata_012875 [Turnera subulata]|uniref:Leucine-rich repeat-containing N-terminal plant-type domain-containing protein n=1 Tax=Turnera subulata TaxID=218843 RepID=A0A9Q0G531_9ROSI|nr:hypothetical protein Tsubulata_012875 [Turnera subulata]